MVLGSSPVAVKTIIPTSNISINKAADTEEQGLNKAVNKVSKSTNLTLSNPQTESKRNTLNSTSNLHVLFLITLLLP